MFVLFSTKNFLLTKPTVQKSPHLQYGEYIAMAHYMVIITTTTLTVASGHEQLETMKVAGHDPTL